MLRRISRWMVTAVALGAIALLDACTTPAPPPSQTASVAPSPPSTSLSTLGSPQPSNSASVVSTPEAAYANTPDGAVAFTEFFAKRANQAYSELNPDLITPLSQDSCGTCKAMVEAINGWKAKNQRYEGQFINPVASTISAFPNDGTAKVLVTSRTSGGRILDANGSVSSTFASESGNVSVSLVRTSDKWSVTSIKGSA